MISVRGHAQCTTKNHILRIEYGFMLITYRVYGMYNSCVQIFIRSGNDHVESAIGHQLSAQSFLIVCDSILYYMS